MFIYRCIRSWLSVSGHIGCSGQQSGQAADRLEHGHWSAAGRGVRKWGTIKSAYKVPA